MSTIADDNFRNLGDGTFRAVQFWVFKNEDTKEEDCYQAVTIFEWKDVSSVQAWMHPSQYESAPEGDKCLIYWKSHWVMLLSPYIEVAKGWQRHRDEKRQRKLRTRYQSISAN